MAVVQKKNLVLIALVLLDAGLKACAWAFLRRRSAPAPDARGLRLGYVENSSGFGFDQARLLGRYGISADDAFVVCTLAVFLVLAALVVLWHRIEARPWIKTAASAAIYLGIATLALTLCDSMSLSLSPYLRGILRGLGPLAIAAALYFTVAERYYSILSLLLLAGTIGNCASLALPPFAVIDYFGIYRTSIMAYVYANAADAYLAAAAAMIALIPAYWLVRFARSSAKRRASSP
jgi:lipoprotein signal peptidase